MIFTTNFSNINRLPNRVVPIAICGKSPDWYNGLEYKKLAPKYEFFIKWKSDHDNQSYIKSYNELILKRLNEKDLIWDFLNLLASNRLNIESDIALVCYEELGSFCHRHIVSEWFRNNNVPCVEYNFDEVIPNIVYKYIRSVVNWEDAHLHRGIYEADQIRRDTHQEMIKYYDIDSELEASITTKNYDMILPGVSRVKHGSDLLKDKETIARDLHSILMYFKFLNNHPITGWYGD